ncbi:MAG TPA: hypothetical protein VJY62_00720 [Bacteroidia bacterium]|nr:hypothetical protein [Bacteroidia bacterium]
MKPLIRNHVLYLRQLILVVIVVTTQSCYHYRVTTSNFDPSTGYEKKTVCSLFWGLAQKDVLAVNCDELKLKSLDEVRVSTNLGYALITVATLGIVCPMTIEWKCPKPCPRPDGDIP